MHKVNSKRVAKKGVANESKDNIGDDETENQDYFQPHEQYKANFKAYKALLATYVKLSDNLTSASMTQEDQVKLKGLKKVLGINANTKKIKTLRSKLKLNI